MSWLMEKSYFREKKECAYYRLKESYRKEWGVYDNQPLSVDYFMVQDKGQSQIYMMEGLRNQSATLSATCVFTLRNIENIHKILNSYFYKSEGQFFLEAIVEDRRKCLLKLHVDMQNTD